MARIVKTRLFLFLLAATCCNSFYATTSNAFVKAPIFESNLDLSNTISSFSSNKHKASTTASSIPLMAHSNKATPPKVSAKEEQENFAKEEWAIRKKVQARKEASYEENDDIGLQEGNPDFKSGFVSIIGNANMGKSTLMNAVMGEKLCIVSPKPQTTRHRILGVLTEESKYQLVFSDTPGMLEPAYKLQDTMQDTIRGAAGDADVIVIVTDIYGEPLLDKTTMQKLGVTTRPIIVAINKVDMAAPELSFDTAGAEATASPTIDNGSIKKHTFTSLKQKLQERKQRRAKDNAVVEADDSSSKSDTEADHETYGMDSERDGERDRGDGKPKSVGELMLLWERWLPQAKVLTMSAIKNEGVQELLDAVFDKVQPGPKYFPSDTLTTRDERFFAAEIIREQLFAAFKDEIPYSCEVVIDSFKDKSDTFSSIEAAVIVSRESQKMIVVGRGGHKIKELGTNSRIRLEEFLDRKIYLGLTVRIDQDWRVSEDALTKYGYIEKD